MVIYNFFLHVEDMLGKVSNGRRLTERKALLFDGLLVLCKPSGGKRVSVTVAAVGVVGHPPHQGELRLKERFFIRKVDIIDREDTEGRFNKKKPQYEKFKHSNCNYLFRTKKCL